MIDKNLCDQFLEEKWDKTLWSYSRVTSYLTCPYNWYETYVLGIRSGNFYAYTGSAYHKIMEDFYNFWLKGGRLDMETIKATLDIKLNRRFQRNPFSHRYEQSTYDALLNSLNYFQIFEDVTSVERLIKWEVDNYKFQGYIDLDAGTYHYDWKSKWSDKYLFQQSLYLFAKEQVDGIITDGFKIPEYKNGLNVVQIDRSESAINDTISMIRTTIPLIKKSLETANFAKDNSDKGFCFNLCASKTCEYK